MICNIACDAVPLAESMISGSCISAEYLQAKAPQHQNLSATIRLNDELDMHLGGYLTSYYRSAFSQEEYQQDLEATEGFEHACYHVKTQSPFSVASST
jgi:hypothetical protein